MPTLQPNEKSARCLRSAFTRGPVIAILALLALAVAGFLVFRMRPATGNAHASEEFTKAKTTKAAGRIVRASWYDVPDDSLAKRRAGDHEMTAAHDRLPLGTVVRVTRPENGQSVLVRITDRGIHRKKIQLDLCREAAQQLGMVEKGIAKVRVEILPDRPGAPPPDSPTTAAQP